MTANDNDPAPATPRRRLVPLLGVIHEDGRFERYKVVELLPHPDDLIPSAEVPE